MAAQGVFGPCGAGLRKDCIRPVCLARHIDDIPPTINNKKVHIPVINKRISTRNKKNYPTRSRINERRDNPLSMKNRGLKDIRGEASKEDLIMIAEPIQPKQDEISLNSQEMESMGN